MFMKATIINRVITKSQEQNSNTHKTISVRKYVVENQISNKENMSHLTILAERM